MESTTEQIVTKLLSSKEILNIKNKGAYITNSDYNLGEFLNNVKEEPSPYEGKYVFIK